MVEEKPRHPIILSVMEIWALEMQLPPTMHWNGENEWSRPEVIHDLRDRVYDALVFCDRNQEPEATLSATIDQCELILSVVSCGIGDQATGQMLGKTILIKTMYAHQGLRLDEVTPRIESPMSPEKRAYMLERIAEPGVFKKPELAVVTQADIIRSIFGGHSEKPTSDPGDDPKGGSPVPRGPDPTPDSGPVGLQSPDNSRVDNNSEDGWGELVAAGGWEANDF